MPAKAAPATQPNVAAAVGAPSPPKAAAKKAGAKSPPKGKSRRNWFEVYKIRHYLLRRKVLI